jgi:hypothetical protein
VTGPLQQVRAVDSGSGYLHDHSATGDDRLRHLGGTQHVGFARGFVQDRKHVSDCRGKRRTAVSCREAVEATGLFAAQWDDA